MSEKKQEVIKITSPAGIAKYPKLNEPDTKFAKGGIGTYSVKLVLSKEAAKPLVDQLEALANESLADAKAAIEAELKDAKGEKKGKLKKELESIKRSDLPVKPVFDDDGNETDEVQITFKMNAARRDKKDETKLIPMRPRFFTVKGEAVPDDRVPNIWGGTKMKVSAQLSKFYTAQAGAGVTLRLNAVQIIKLVTGSGMNAADHGFGAEEEEDGFTLADAPEAAPKSTPAGDEQGDGGGETEF